MTGIVIPFDFVKKVEDTGEQEFDIVFTPEGQEEPVVNITRLACNNCRNQTYKLEVREDLENSEIAAAHVVCAACDEDLGVMGWVDFFEDQ